MLIIVGVGCSYIILPVCTTVSNNAHMGLHTEKAETHTTTTHDHDLHHRMPTTVVHLSYADQQCRQAPPSTQGAPVAGSLAISPPDPPANQRHSVLRVLWEMNSWGMLTVPAAVVGAPGVGQLEVKALGVHEGVHALPHANLREVR